MQNALRQYRKEQLEKAAKEKETDKVSDSPKKAEKVEKVETPKVEAKQTPRQKRAKK